MVTHNNTRKKEINSVCTQRQDNQNKNQIRLTLEKTISSADVYSTDIYHAAPAFTSTLTPCSPSALPNNNRFCSTTKKHKKKYLDAFCGTGRQRTRALWNSYQPPIPANFSWRLGLKDTFMYYYKYAYEDLEISLAIFLDCYAKPK